MGSNPEHTQCPYCGDRAHAEHFFHDVIDVYPYGYWAQTEPYHCEDCLSCEAWPGYLCEWDETGEQSSLRYRPEAGLTPEEDRIGWRRGPAHVCRRPTELCWKEAL